MMALLAVEAFCQPPQGSVFPQDEGFLTDSFGLKGGGKEGPWG